jgi:hypothetical protein
MSDDTVSGEMVVLPAFDVVAIDGKGIWVTDGESAWHVGGPFAEATADNDLVAAYRAAFD